MTMVKKSNIRNLFMGRPKWLRDSLAQQYWLQNGKCFYCHEMLMISKHEKGVPSPRKMITVDHIVPVSVGGKKKSLIVAACYRCNTKRGSMPWLDFVALTNARLKCKSQ